ncbi:hypothetical protein CHH26_14005 [Qipengyuania flava]|nr:hypothetical protein CHH26_14005 [Qipengyuania flava]
MCTDQSIDAAVDLRRNHGRTQSPGFGDDRISAYRTVRLAHDIDDDPIDVFGTTPAAIGKRGSHQE